MVIRQNQTAWNNSVSGSRICRACNGFDFHPRNSKSLHFLRTTTQQQGNLTTDLFCFLSGDDFKPVWILRSPTSFCNSTSGLSVTLQELFVQVSVNPQRPPTGLLLIFFDFPSSLATLDLWFYKLSTGTGAKASEKKGTHVLIDQPHNCKASLDSRFQDKSFSLPETFCGKTFL